MVADPNAAIFVRPDQGNLVFTFYRHGWRMDMQWPSTEPVSNGAHTSLKRLQSAIAIASGLAVSGRAVDLAGLDSVAGLLCAQVLDLPPEAARAMRPLLLAVDENVAGLIATLTVSHR